MIVDEKKCLGCGVCTVYCPNDAISMVDVDCKKKAWIDQDLCLECGTCIRPRAIHCPANAFCESPEESTSISRKMRRFFSDPSTTHPLTGVPGRGTEEVKTNDVTGRVCRGELGVCLEFGRPILGVKVTEIEKATKRLAKIGIKLEECNPLYALIADHETGEFKHEYIDGEYVSAILEFVIPIDRGEEVLKECKAIAAEIETVFSLDLICCYDADGTNPAISLLDKLDIAPRQNAKVNLGIGRPFKIER